MMELAYHTDRETGYGTLVRQITTGLSELGLLADVVATDGVVQRTIYHPRSPALHEWVDPATGLSGLRWINTDGTRAVFGSRYNRWINDHDFVVREHEPATREATRLCCSLPRDADYAGASKRVLFTMWESSQVPFQYQPWGPELDRADLILAPSEHSAEVIGDATDRPVRVVPLALEAERWPYYDRRGRPESRPFVFLMAGDLSLRKGVDVAAAAFWKAFGRREDVVLVLKARGQSPFCEWQRNRDNGHFRHDRWNYRWMSGQPNIRVLRGNWSRSALAELYRHADCFVWPTRGEGWGYPPREAAATGLPVITCDHTGQASASEWAYTIPYDPTGHYAKFRTWGECGTMAEPDVDALVDAMLWQVGNREEALDFAEGSSSVVKTRGPRDLVADIVKEVDDVSD